MFQKLKGIIFSKGTLQWFRSYLSELIFLVHIESNLVSKTENSLINSLKIFATGLWIKKLSIHFDEDKTKYHINIKHYLQVTYIGCVLDEKMSCEPMALRFINNTSRKLKFLYRKNRYLTKELRRMQCSYSATF